MIRSEKCLELGLPAPKKHEYNIGYILRAIENGNTINSRQADYIGIRNFNSHTSTIRNTKKIETTSTNKMAFCPEDKSTPSQPVIHLSMTQEQRQQYQNRKNKNTKKRNKKPA